MKKIFLGIAAIVIVVSAFVFANNATTESNVCTDLSCTLCNPSSKQIVEENSKTDEKHICTGDCCKK